MKIDLTIVILSASISLESLLSVKIQLLIINSPLSCFMKVSAVRFVILIFLRENLFTLTVKEVFPVNVAFPLPIIVKS